LASGRGVFRDGAMPDADLGKPSFHSALGGWI
jgi:hypothetical protein